jgi:hypothetical protein
MTSANAECRIQRGSGQICNAIIGQPNKQGIERVRTMMISIASVVVIQGYDQSSKHDLTSEYFN